jgi:hypothetical protein
MDDIFEKYEELSEPWVCNRDDIKAMRDEVIERAAKIADLYGTIESRAIAQDIRSLKYGRP